MSLYVDVEYCNRLSPYLRNFKKKNSYLWNFSCRVCGDSKTKKNKARGYVYKGVQGNLGLFVKCHNCGYSTNLGNFIEFLDPVLHKEYVLAKYRESGAPRTPHKDIIKNDALPDIFKQSRKIVQDDVLSSLIPINKLTIDHPVMEYVKSRQIPKSKYDRLFVTAKFKHYVNSITSNKIAGPEHPRLIIPFLNEHGKCFAFQGRAFGSEQPKYYTIKLDKDYECVYGLDRVDFSKKIFVVEGPLDSLFLPNCIAVTGSSFDIEAIRATKALCVLVYDNEPRAKEITKLMHRCIMKGYKVCVWPSYVEEKDINEMILAGRSPVEILNIINENTFQGAAAELAFTTWRKCK